MTTTSSNILGLDVGTERVGAGLLRGDVQVPVVLTTLARKAPDFWEQLGALIHDNDIGGVVLGLPRGLESQTTAQTTATQAFGAELTSRLNVPIHWQDEALTSVKAEELLRASGKPYEKADIDAMAAVILLGDFIGSTGASL